MTKKEGRLLKEIQVLITHYRTEGGFKEKETELILKGLVEKQAREHSRSQDCRRRSTESPDNPSLVCKYVSIPEVLGFCGLLTPWPF